MQIRENIISDSPDMAAFIKIVEAASFIVCLDDASPTGSTECFNQYLLSTSSNRWSDKSLQLVVCSNGLAGTVVEHSMLDGGSVEQLHAALINSVEAPIQIQSAQQGEIKLRPGAHNRLSVEINDEIAKDIRRIEQTHSAISASMPSEVKHYSLSQFGGVFLRSHGCAPKTGWQITIQLASYIYFGYLQPSWETVTLRSFHKGRVDIIQAVQPSVFSFCSAALDSVISNSKKRLLFEEAAREYTATIMKASRGKGFVGHLYALQEVCEKDEKLPTLFEKGGMYSKTRPGKLMTDSVQSSLNREAGWVMPDPEHVLVHYEVHDER
jgi:hypothetical protein